MTPVAAIVVALVSGNDFSGQPVWAIESKSNAGLIVLPPGGASSIPGWDGSSGVATIPYQAVDR
jgi:hypothetical protein